MNMIYGELGIIPMSIHAKFRFYKIDEPVFHTSNWIRFIRSNLNILGFSEMYTTQNIPYSSSCFKNKI